LFTDEEDEEDTDQLSEVAEEELEVLVFQLGKEKYAMSIHDIAEIIRFMEPTEVPHTVGFLDGIVSLRGKMIPVINGRKRLGHPAVIPDRKTRIIVIRQNNENFGMLVDSASQVIRIQKKSIEATPAVVTGVDAEFINGVCEHKNQILILLNLDRFLLFQ